MASKSAINLDPAEWDFRPLADCEDELSLAVHYEYTRQCPWITKAFKDCLDEEPSPYDVDGDQLFPDEWLGWSRRKLIDRCSRNGLGGRIEWSQLWNHLWDGLDERLQFHALGPSILFLKDFPEPYLDARKRPGFDRLLKEEKVFKEKMPDSPFFQCDANGQCVPFGDLDNSFVKMTFCIDMTARRDDLKKGFSDWLERKHIPETGKTGEKRARLNLLKWLAALRLSEHYKRINRNLVEIASDLSKSNLGLDSFGDESVIPFYEEGSSLSRASGRARRFIKSEIACYTKKRFRIAGPVEIRRVAWLE
jgi:hypothetical protein